MATIRVTQEEYHKVRDQQCKLTTVYPVLDESKFVEWLRKKFNLEPFESYTIEVAR